MKSCWWIHAPSHKSQPPHPRCHQEVSGSSPPTLRGKCCISHVAWSTNIMKKKKLFCQVPKKGKLSFRRISFGVLVFSTWIKVFKKVKEMSILGFHLFLYKESEVFQKIWRVSSPLTAHRAENFPGPLQLRGRKGFPTPQGFSCVGSSPTRPPPTLPTGVKDTPHSSFGWWF